MMVGDSVTIPDGRTGVISQINGRSEFFVHLDEDPDRDRNPLLFSPSELINNESAEELNRRMQERIKSSEHKSVIEPYQQHPNKRRLKSKVISWIIVCGIIALILYTCSRCDLPPSKNPAPVKTETQKSKDKEERRRLMRGEYDDIFGLLAIKYDVGIDTVDYISTEYLRIFNPGEYFIITIDDPQKDTTIFGNTHKPKQTISFTINYLAEKFHLEKSKVASIIFDFRLYFKKQ